MQRIGRGGEGHEDSAKRRAGIRVRHIVGVHNRPDPAGKCAFSGLAGKKQSLGDEEMPDREAEFLHQGPAAGSQVLDRRTKHMVGRGEKRFGVDVETTIQAGAEIKTAKRACAVNVQKQPEESQAQAE